MTGFVKMTSLLEVPPMYKAPLSVDNSITAVVSAGSFLICIKMETPVKSIGALFSRKVILKSGQVSLHLTVKFTVRATTRLTLRSFWIRGIRSIVCLYPCKSARSWEVEKGQKGKLTNDRCWMTGSSR